ncbi:unnamed protein product [Polarella glacialis]|uniref:Uncharacterized protein n=1 Tax=Polarella glacialis TaxID=89957 RepID=A0A813FLE0_POLGL|nr:unnamed protein product [Polarella glacialis]
MNHKKKNKVTGATGSTGTEPTGGGSTGGFHAAGNFTSYALPDHETFPAAALSGTQWASKLISLNPAPSQSSELTSRFPAYYRSSKVASRRESMPSKRALHLNVQGLASTVKQVSDDISATVPGLTLKDSPQPLEGLPETPAVASRPEVTAADSAKLVSGSITISPFASSLGRTQPQLAAFPSSSLTSPRYTLGKAQPPLPTHQSLPTPLMSPLMSLRPSPEDAPQRSYSTATTTTAAPQRSYSTATTTTAAPQRFQSSVSTTTTAPQRFQSSVSTTTTVPGNGFLNRSTATVVLAAQATAAPTDAARPGQAGGPVAMSGARSPPRTEGRGAYPMTVIRAWDSPAVPGLAPPTAPSGAAMAALAMASASGPSKPQMPTTIWAPRDMILPSSCQQIPPDERAARAYSRQQEQEAAGRRRRWSLERKNASGMRRGPGEDVDFSSKFLRLQAKLGNLAEEGTVSL